MPEIKKTISADDRLKFIALMTMAAEHIREVRKIELTIRRMTGEDDGGHVSDAIYAGYSPNTTVRELDDLLNRMGIAVDGDTHGT